MTYVPHGGEPNPLLAAAVVRAALPPLTTPPKPLRPPKPGREPSGLRKADAETLRVHLHAQGFGLNTPSCLLPYASSSGWAIPAPTTKPPGTTPASGWPITWPTICARPSRWRSRSSAWSPARLGADNVLLLKPNTYMNRSGQAVGALARFYKLAPEAVLVLHDELDLMPGQVKLKQGGGHAGHNGLKDIQAALGSPNFWRLRIGIGHPRTLGLAQQVADFVLHPPRREEQTAIEAVIDRCRAVVPAMLAGDFPLATRQLHSGNDA